ncbi:hypothetical protein [Halorussus salinus]|uniref:hypothetical protein n=1 Tax=Halorussus salinus TaxID=1364935 RepID=UPI001092F00E|nr:hypothetical protein [Halorussus salinus]
MRNGLLEKADIAVLIPLVFLSTVLAFPELSDPLIEDEGWFFVNVRYLDTNGYPRGIHPPLYTFFVYAVSAAIGSTEPVITRASTFLFTLGTIFPVYFSTKLIVRENLVEIAETFPKSVAPALSSLLYILSPLAVQTGVLIDMENVFTFLLSAFFFWFLYAYELDETTPIVKYAITASFVYVLSWNKFGPLPPLLLTFCCYFGITRRWSEMTRFAFSVVGGFVAFVITWGGLSLFTGTRFLTPFVTDAQFVSRVTYPELHALPLKILNIIYYEILWISPFLLLLCLVVIFPRLEDLRGVRNTHFTQVLQTEQAVLLPFVLFSLLTIVEYGVLLKGSTYDFTKYMGRVMPLLTIAAGVGMGRVKIRPTKRWSAQVAGGSLVVAGVIFALADPIAGAWSAPGRRLLIYSGLLVPIAIVWGASTVLLNQHDSTTKRAIVTSILLVAVLGSNVGLVAMQATASYSTRYYYGTSGTGDAIDYVGSEIACNESATVGGPYGMRHQLQNTYTEDAERLFTVRSKGDVVASRSDIVVVLSRSYYFPSGQQVLELGNYTKLTQFGDYSLFVRSSYQICRRPT